EVPLKKRSYILFLFCSLAATSFLVSHQISFVQAEDGYSFDAANVEVGRKSVKGENDDGSKWVGESPQGAKHLEIEEEVGIKAEVFVPAPRPPRPRKVIFDQADKSRISKGLKARAQLIAEQHEKFKIVESKNPRGEPELRVCTVSTEGYGLS